MSSEQKDNLLIGKEKHVVNELFQHICVERGNGKIDMVGLIDGLHLYTACVFCLCVSLSCQTRSKHAVEKHIAGCTHINFFVSTSQKLSGNQ